MGENFVKKYIVITEMNLVVIYVFWICKYIYIYIYIYIYALRMPGNKDKHNNTQY